MLEFENVERYIKEYANAKKCRILDNELMTSYNKIKAFCKINEALKMRNKGFITIDETILEILNCTMEEK